MAHINHTTVVILLALCCIGVECATKGGHLRAKRSARHAQASASESYIGKLFEMYGYRDVLSVDSLKSIVLKMGLEGMYHGNGSHGGHDGHDHDGHNHVGDGHHDGHDHDGHGHDHDGHGHDDDGHGHDHDGHGHDHDGHGHDHHPHKRAVNNDTKKQCPTMGGLLTEFVLGDSDKLDITDFLYLCPALIYNVAGGACDIHDGHDHKHDHKHAHGHNNGSEVDDDRNVGLVWFYLMISVTIISLCAVWGILCIPKRTRSSYEMVIQFLMALGAGSMAGDALLHLLPHALMPPHDHSAHGDGGHDHGHDGHDHGDGHDDHSDHGNEHTEALLKGLVALIGLYAFFALERLFSILLARSAKKSGNMDAKACGLHSHGEPLEDVKFIPVSESNNTAISELSPNSDNGKTHHWPHAHNGSRDNIEESPSESRINKLCPKLTPLAMMIVLGDMFHNFCDGVAMGAAFSSSTTVGISTSLAVFCHEFPHEIGDFAILIKSGLSKKWAVCLNFVSALTCYLGAVLGMLLGNSVGNAPMWIFAGVAGMFLYIALVDLIPEMTHIYLSPGKRWGVFLALHAAGLFLGSLFMLILGFYEHDIQSALG